MWFCFEHLFDYDEFESLVDEKQQQEWKSTNKLINLLIVWFIYRLIRNSNGLTTIRLIQPNSPQSQQMDEYPSHNSEKSDRSSPMATDLRKLD